MDILKLLQDCIKNYDLNVKTLRDIAFAICISDKLNGSNKIELDVDKFVESDSELSWVEILKLLGIEPQSKGCSKLPRVQKLRVISDILSLCLSDKVEDLTLSCSSSKKVANVLGVSLSYADYSDENSCYENLKKIESTLEESSFEKDIEVVEVLELLTLYNVDLPTNITKLDEHYFSSLYTDSFKPCRSDEFNKRDFVKDINCFLMSVAIDLDDFKWISLYNILDTVADFIGRKKLVYCITPEIRSKLSKCTRLYNGVNLIGNCSYYVYDYNFTRVFIISLYSEGVVKDLNKYIK